MENLNLEQMQEISGGEVTTRAQYCATMQMICKYGWSSWNDHQREAWCNAWYQHCAESYDIY